MAKVTIFAALIIMKKLSIMKINKIFKAALLAASLFVVESVSAQNIQLHYDFGRHFYSDAESSRPHVTLTLEQFKADNLGSWFYFVDVDMRNHGSVTAYTEIAREFNVKKDSPFAVHVEYDGGVNERGAFQHVALAGGAYNWHSEDFSKTWSLQLLYRQMFGGGGVKAMSGAQLTTVWGVNFANNKLTFSGFADVWYGYKSVIGESAKGFVFITEPQLWFNITNKFSMGTEFEISHNFIYSNTDTRFFVNPTLAAKVKF